MSNRHPTDPAAWFLLACESSALEDGLLLAVEARREFQGLCPTLKAKLQAECAAFCAKHVSLIREACEVPGYGILEAGHDFWLIRTTPVHDAPGPDPRPAIRALRGMAAFAGRFDICLGPEDTLQTVPD